MKKVWLLPIEPFEERYTADWFRWYCADLRSCGHQVETVMGAAGAGERTGGEWLDPTKTWEWKGTQLASLAARWKDIRDGDVILLMDGWGPASTAALYMRATTKKDVKIVAFFHAGCFDPHDYLPRMGCSPWGLDIEKGWAKGLDLLLVGSEYSANLIRQHLTAEPRIAVVGCPIKKMELNQYNTDWDTRKPIVLFPHRLAPEKGLEDWESIVEMFETMYPNEAEFVRTRDVYTDKASLYEWLGRSKVVVSCAKQETFGIVMQEGVALGCHPLYPSRLSYPEVMKGEGLPYESIKGACEALKVLLDRTQPSGWDSHHEMAVHRISDALEQL